MALTEKQALELVKYSVDDREAKMIYAIQHGMAWHPDVTAGELLNWTEAQERAGKYKTYRVVDCKFKMIYAIKHDMAWHPDVTVGELVEWTEALERAGKYKP